MKTRVCVKKMHVTFENLFDFWLCAQDKLSSCNTCNNVINCHGSLLLDRGFKPPASCALHFPAPILFTGSLPWAIFRLQNIKHCCVISFIHFPPAYNAHLSLFPLPPLPPPIIPSSYAPVFPCCSVTSQLKQGRFWTTHVNRKWTTCTLRQCVCLNFRAHCLYKSKYT